MKEAAPTRAGGTTVLRPAAERTVEALLLLGIHAYRAILSPLLGGLCRFTPSCSRYAEAAIRAHGPWRGAWLGGRRLLRCRPFGGRGYDPIPEPPDPPRGRTGPEPWRRGPTPALRRRETAPSRRP